MSSLLALLFVVLAASAPQAASAGWRAQAGEELPSATTIVARPAAQDQQQPPATGSSGQQQPPTTAGTTGGQSPSSGGTSGQEAADVNRIRKALEHPDLIKLDIPSTLPEGSTRYKVQVKAYSFKLPTLAESLHIPWAPTPAGGLYNYEIMQMITPPDVRGSAPFTNGEMAWVAATSLLSALAMREVASAYRGFQRSWRTMQEEKAHEEVQRELAEFLRQQAAAKNGATTTDPVKKDPNKKDPDKQ